MDWIRRYIIGLLAAAMICSILETLVQNTGFKKQIHLLTGLFLSFTLVRPLLNLDFPSISTYTESIREEGEAAASAGEMLSVIALKERIQQEAETYIWNKASSMGARVTVKVTVSDQAPYTPEAVTITGSIREESQNQICQMLENSFSIPKERQTWIYRSGEID